ncbi:hypothetical protein ACQP2U_43975 (plasmid) [Nocardia sp. CA-084685]|uniref:hypothetical protein n=1 Tax=Nocardia sp. CA-084685 TaxID=3239970 RepID=UPI003D97B77D
MSRENQRAGHPLRTVPEDFPKSLPHPTRVLNAALNQLMIDAGLTRKQVIAMAGLDLTDKQCSRQMGERRAGPSLSLFEAILSAAAHKLDISVDELGRTYLPLLRQAQAAASGSNPMTGSIAGQLGSSPAVLPVIGVSIPGPARTLAEKAEWLANLLVDNDEQRAAAELDDVFGQDNSMLVEALVKVGALDPGMIAALLDEIRRRDGDPRSTSLFEAIRSRDEQVAHRIAAVPLREAAGRKPSILESDPVRLFGRRMATLIQKGHADQACREIVARIGELLRATQTESILGGIIESSSNGPALASALLSVMAEDHREEMFRCVVQLLRHARSAERIDLLCSLDDALTPEMRATILLLLSRNSRLPNTHGLDSEELYDLAIFMKTLRETSTRLIAVVADEPIAHSRDLAAGHLVESIPHFGPILGLMVAARFTHTVHLLARALSDWDARVQAFNGFPAWYQPVKDLAGAVLGMPAGMQLTSEMLTRHPRSGALLFDAMQSLNHARFPVLLAELVANHVTVDALAQTIVGVDEEPRRLRIFEKLIKDTPTDADPIMRQIVAKYPAQINKMLPLAGKHAPQFTERMIELLSDQKSRKPRSPNPYAAAPTTIAELLPINRGQPDGPDHRTG